MPLIVYVPVSRQQKPNNWMSCPEIPLLDQIGQDPGSEGNQHGDRNIDCGGNMTDHAEESKTLDAHTAVTVMSVLGHKLRIEIWRTLLPVGARGLSAGTLSVRLDVAPSSLSFHLQRMSRAGLLIQRNDRRNTIYAANNDIVDALCMFLSRTTAVRSNANEPILSV
jgi:ArsR family transcriptional regulator, arsenate/arsenite/antimonite-responsive transcriptional repressor